MRAADISRIDSVITFWFDGPGKGKHYWAGGPEQQRDLDVQIEHEFGDLIKEVSAGHLGTSALREEWAKTARGSLALILLLDQWSRNVYRGTPKAFTQDPLAQQICLEGIVRGQHLELSDDPTDETGSSMRQMFLIPLFHAETVELLQKALEMLPFANYTWGIENYTRSHMEQLTNFGRIPSRNKARGLQSTPEEKAAGHE